MTTNEAAAPTLTATFAEAMSRLASGLAVVTARRVDGSPCGLLVSAVCSYSADPPSLLISIGRSTRSYWTLVDCTEFGVHLLGNTQWLIAKAFAGRSTDKFADLAWNWDDDVPRLADVPVYLRCVRRRVINEGDHAIVIGDLIDADVQDGRPLVYYRRQLDWTLV